MATVESDFLFFIMKPLAIFAISIVGFILVFRKTKTKKRPVDFYTNPDWNFFLKKWWANRTIQKRIKAEQEIHMPELRNEKIENPRPLETDTSSDSQMIYGEDTEGNSIFIKLTRRRHRIASVWIVLRLEDGRVFNLPDQPDTQVFNVNEESFNAGGLTMECLIPFVSWRIRFNGYLRQGAREEWTPDLKEEELVTVKFNFFWQVKGKPLYWPFDWSTHLMATSSATEPWQDGKWMQQLENVDSVGYDQYGAMRGEIFISGEAKEETFELNLPGMRQRRWGPHKINHLRRTGCIIGVCRDGMVFNIGGMSSNAGLTHAQFGNVLLPGGSVAPIDWTDFHLRNFGEHRSVHNAQTIRFGVGKQQFTVVVHLKSSSKIPLFGGRPLEWHSDNYPLELMVNGEEGKGIAILWYPTDGTETPLIPHIPQYRRVINSSAKTKSNKFVYHFSEEETSSVQISGGKGASLALLTSISRMTNIVDRNYANDQLFKDNRHQHLSPIRKQSISQLCSPDFTVPSGFVLSVSAMDSMVNSSRELNASIEKLVKLCEDGLEYEEQCQLIRALVEKLELSEAIKCEVLKALRLISVTNNGEVVRIAVRSSSVCEDGEDVSAAGQNETFLGLKTEEDILQAIKKCWASMYSYQSVHYRKQNIQLIRTGMAVVVQIMLDADCAGVLFSQHPITGHAKQCLISANYGLGESVVSGEVDPDNYIVRRSYNDDKFTVVEKVCGKKGFKIQMSSSSDNTVEKVNVDGDDFCLSDEIVVRLSEIGVVLEKLYGSGRDIEWGLKENQIFLLQSRPITSLNQFTDWELIHESDTAIMSQEDLCTTANIQEVMPGSVCPLSIDNMANSVEQAVHDAIDGKGSSIVFDRLWSISRSHIFMDVYKLFFRGNSKELPLDKRIIAISVAGHDIITPEIHRISLKRFPPNANFNRKLTVFIVKAAWNCKKNVKKATALAKSFNCQYSPQNLVYFRTAKDLFDNIESHLPITYETSSIHCLTSAVSSFYNVVTMSILAGNKKQFTDDLNADSQLINSSAKNSESAEVPKKLEQMAKGIFLSGKKDLFCAVEPDHGPKWLEKNIPEVHIIFQQFLDQNKHRGYKEFDVCSPSWGIRPGMIIEMLQSLLKFTKDADSLGKTNDVISLTPKQIVNALKSPMGGIAKKILQRTIAWAQNAVMYREQTKSNCISVIHEFRLAYRHLGTMMVKEGYLPQPDLVFYLKRRELAQLLKSRDVHLIKKALRRKKLLPDLDKERYPELVWGVPKPINAKKTLHFESGTEIRGTPVYAGVVTGRACVIHHFSEVSKIVPGDILITHSTDIAWSPYFPILGGVVTELGGLISHGAVVAREYGLPCIVAAEQATDFFQFGETITLDSKNGVIFKGTGNRH